MTQQGFFVIADITGYTAFLTGSELEHAQDILKTLFDTLLDSIKPPLTISNFKGDAILTYAPKGTFSNGQTLIEIVENIYMNFTKKRELMHLNTTCTCKACANIPLLDLKLFVHFGEYVFQDMRGKLELSGPDVIIAHRMMKNRVKEEIGLQAYSLFSAAAVKALGLEDFTCEMHDHSETYDHIGEVKMYAYCLKTMWEKRRDVRRDIVRPETAWYKYEVDLAVPRALVWEYLFTPEKRIRTVNAKGFTQAGKMNGRTAVGSTFHCAHGMDMQTDFTILDWQPFDYATERMTGLPLGLASKVTTQMSDTENGTHVAVCVDPFQTNSSWKAIAVKLLDSLLKKKFESDYKYMLGKIEELITADLAAQPAAPPVLAAQPAPAAV